MELVVRTWNVFHGRTVPGTHASHLERMIALVAESPSAVVALQEVPVWALARLAAWSGMRAEGAVAMPALGGPLARPLTAVDPDRIRSALTGQANAVLLGPELRPDGPARVVRLNPWSVRRKSGPSSRDRVEWLRNRRVCQLVPVRAGETSLVVANVHASKPAALARIELDRLRRLLPEGPVILCGDLNAPETGLPGFSDPIPGIDQVLVRGLDLRGRPARWPAERRRHGGALLSDHAPVEAVVAVGSEAG